jgi:hypothetical protein
VELLHHGLAHLGRIERGEALMFARTGAFRPARADWTQAAGVAAVLFVLYAVTAPRTVALEDDGLFVLSSYFFGIEHPPGYPLFTLIGKLFTHLPFGSVAYRVHLASALFGALSCGALWLCARALTEGRLPAYLAAFGLGVSPVFWSQSIIAEVYTFNTFFFLVLVYLGLRVCPPGLQTGAPGENPRILPWMALIFGLSLSNHWPLMLLAAPAFAVLLWPKRIEILRRLPLLVFLAVLGLVPYAWMVVLSWAGLSISYYGPLESFADLWYVVSRAGYAQVDVSLAATWLDRLKFFQFVVAQLLVQFAVLGTALAAAGFVVQRRAFGLRIAAFLTVAFIMPTGVLLLLLGFEYDAISKHVFHVFPLPAYAVVALWLGLGFAWLIERVNLRLAHALAGGTALIALMLGLASRSNLRADHDWSARYAQALVRTLPRDAILFVGGDLEVGSIGYFHMVENLRPDITLYQSGGLVLGNRLFHPLRTNEETRQRKLREFIEQQGSTVAFSSEFLAGYARRDRWLYTEVDKSSRDPTQVIVDIPEEALDFLEESVLDSRETNAWIAYYQGELRLRYALLLGRSLTRGQPLDERRKRHLAALERDFHGALGLAQGLMVNKQGYAAGVVLELLNRARDLMPADADKPYQTKFFSLRGILRLQTGDQRGAIQDLESALAVWPTPQNPALSPLEDLYRAEGDTDALRALNDRVKRPKR